MVNAVSAGSRDSEATEASRQVVSRLLAPVTIEAFLAEYFDRQPALLRGEAERGHGLLSHEGMIAALAADATAYRRLYLATEAWTGGDLGPPAWEALAPDRRRERLERYLAAGYPLIWNGARSVSPAVARTCRALSELFQAHVWPNVYATGGAGTPLKMHFDPHEVFAVQCHGRKTWTLSRARAHAPLQHREMAAAVAAAVAQGRGEAEAKPWLTFAAEPGDVVYIPRGQFHNAAALDGRSLHVTFSVQPLTGYDAMLALDALAMADPLVREYFPMILADPDGERAAGHLARLRERLRALLDGDALEREVAAARARLVAQGDPAD